MGILAILGFVIGWFINKDSPWPIILAIVGLIFGLFSFITYLLYLLKEEEKEKKKEDLDGKKE